MFFNFNKYASDAYGKERNFVNFHMKRWKMYLKCLEDDQRDLGLINALGCKTFCMSIGMFVCPSICLSVRLSICLSVRLSVSLSVRLSVSLSLCPSVCLSVYLSVCLSTYLSVRLPVCYLLICKSVCLSFNLSVRLSVCLSACLSTYLSLCLLSSPHVCNMYTLYVYNFCRRMHTCVQCI